MKFSIKRNDAKYYSHDAVGRHTDDLYPVFTKRRTFAGRFYSSEEASEKIKMLTSGEGYGKNYSTIPRRELEIMQPINLLKELVDVLR